MCRRTSLPENNNGEQLLTDSPWRACGVANVSSVPFCTAPFVEIAVQKEAQGLLLPVTCRQLFDLSDELAAELDIASY